LHPSSETSIVEGDTLIVMGNSTDVAKREALMKGS